MKRHPAAFRKSDLVPAFEAAIDSGFNHVSVVVKTEDGRRFMITAKKGDEAVNADMTPLEKWDAGRAS